MKMRPIYCLQLAIGVISVLGSISCKSQKEKQIGQAEVKSNYPADGIDQNLLSSFVNDIKKIVSSGGAGTMTTEELFKFFPLTDEERAIVVKAHPRPVTVKCVNRDCTFISYGSPTSTWVRKLPGGFVSLSIGAEVKLRIRLLGPNSMEICNTKNIDVSPTGVPGSYGTFYGAMLNLDSDPPETFVTYGWSKLSRNIYPKSDCPL